MSASSDNLYTFDDAKLEAVRNAKPWMQVEIGIFNLVSINFDLKKKTNSKPYILVTTHTESFLL